MKSFKKTLFYLLLVLLVVALVLTGCGSGSGDIPQNLKPVAVDDSATTDDDITISIDVLANDISSSGDLRITGVNQPDKGQVTIENNKISYIPDDTGDYSFSYHIADDNGTATAIVRVTVNLGLGDLPIRRRY
ncbi:MAG: cadherin-like domain-containing protein [Firmicutes bacterium]|nr:cadherin-like domain-containing protein [Bacillota bacterium]